MLLEVWIVLKSFEPYCYPEVEWNGVLDWNVDLYCHGLVDVEYNVTRILNESIGLGHRCNSGPHTLE